MKRLQLLRFALLFLIFALINACGTTVTHDLIISNVNIINTKTGEILENRTIGIDSNRISIIYDTDVSASWSSTEVEGNNGYLIPGLWDMHAHYQSNDNHFSKLLLANGVTGIREMWGNMDSTNHYRLKNKQGYFGPDIYSAGAIIDGVPQMWPESAGVSNAEEAKAEVLKQIDQGVDFIKVYSGLNKEAFDAIAKTANEQNITFAGHIPNSTNIFHAIEKGMSSSEHGLGLITGSSSKGDSLLQAGNTPYIDPTPFLTTFSEQRFDSLCNLLVQSEMWLCPTFIVNQNYNLLDKPEELQKSPLLAYIKRDLKSKWFVYKDDSVSTSKHKKGSELLLNLVSKAHAKGVKILAGSDFPNPYTIPGFSMHDELEILVSGGIDELSVLQMATYDAATFMNRTADFGTVEEGKVASVVLLSDNPLENIANTRTIEAVIQRGQLYDKQALEQLLASVKEEVAREQTPYSKVFKNMNNELGIDAALDSLTTLIQSSNPNYFLDEIDLAYVMGDFLNEGKMDELVQFGEYMPIWFPESHRAYLWSGDAYMQAGYYDKARQQLNKSLELNPDSERAKQYLEELEEKEKAN